MADDELQTTDTATAAADTRGHEHEEELREHGTRSVSSLSCS